MGAARVVGRSEMSIGMSMILDEVGMEGGSAIKGTRTSTGRLGRGLESSRGGTDLNQLAASVLQVACHFAGWNGAEWSLWR